MWLIILLDQLSIVDLVSHYLTNYLMERELILMRTARKSRTFLHSPGWRGSLSGISSPFGLLSRSWGQIIHVLRTRAPLYSGPKPLSRSTCMC